MVVAVSILLIAAGWVLLFSVGGALAGVSVNVLAAGVLAAGVVLLFYGLSLRPPRRRRPAR